MAGSGSRARERLILGLETSCDETAAAVITDDGEILANVVSSQAELHAKYGGVVPEVASRRHLELVMPVLREALGEAGIGLDRVERVTALTAVDHHSQHLPREEAGERHEQAGQEQEVQQVALHHFPLEQPVCVPSGRVQPHL